MPSPRSSAVIETPCLGICAVPRGGEHCVGCGRSLQEIGAWAQMAPAARRAVMDQLPARLARLKAAPAPGADEKRAGKGRADGEDALR